MNHDDLRALAKATTPGPWKAVGHGAPRDRWWTVNTATGMRRQICRVMSFFGHDAAFIAAVSPPVVLGLLDEIERLNRIEVAAVEAALDLDVAMQRYAVAPDNAIVVERAMDDVDGARHALRAALGTATPSGNREE